MGTISNLKPALTVAVGITGHRSARLPAEYRDNIEHCLGEVFGSIEAECKDVLEKQQDFYTGSKAVLRLVSSLADGADAIAVRLRPQTWSVIGILPYPEEIYVEALRSSAAPGKGDDAVAEFSTARAATTQMITLPTSGPQDKLGFSRARTMMLNQIDLLVAIWDGKDSDNAGGTGDVVKHALQEGIPVVWISSVAKQPASVISQLPGDGSEGRGVEAEQRSIAEAVRQVLGFRERETSRLQQPESEAKGERAEERFRDFLNDEPPDSYGWQVYNWFKIGPGLWKWRLKTRLTSIDDVRKDWTTFLAALPAAGEFNGRLAEVLLPRYAIADALATYYSHKYRSAYILAYLLSVCAVAAALCDYIFLDSLDDMRMTNLRFPFLELLFIGLIIGIVWRGQSKQWHNRWLDYRSLAETLRHLRFLGILGQYRNNAYTEATGRPGAGWVLWYLRATMRELGAPSGYFGPDYQQKALSAILDSELRPQIEYHTNNTKLLNLLHHRLHRLGDFCFVAAAVILLTFMIAYSLASLAHVNLISLKLLASVATVSSAFLPTLGAALAGIRFTGDFEGFAERSAYTSAELGLLEKHFATALDRLHFDTTTEVVIETARIMAVDFTSWTALYSRKRLSLPA